MQRILGIIMIAIGVSGLVLSFAGLIASQRLVDNIGTGIEANLTLTIESLDTVNETLLLSKVTVGQMSEALLAVEETADNVVIAINDTQPLLEQASQVTTEDVPESIEAFQNTLPALTDVAATIDDTLRTLSAFGFQRSILGVPLGFDLGIDYDPEVPFDQSVEDLGASLEGMPDDLRSLKRHLDQANRNLSTIGDNIDTISGNLGMINENVSEVEPLIDDYLLIVTELSDSARQTRSFVTQQLGQVKLIVTIIAIWLGLAQFAPIYLGWELLVRGRGTETRTDTRTEAVVLDEDNGKDVVS